MNALLFVDSTLFNVFVQSDAYLVQQITHTHKSIECMGEKKEIITSKSALICSAIARFSGRVRER